MSKISKQSEFLQVKYNEAKMGAYYTDLEHCTWMSNFLDFPEAEVCCLDPSIGDGKAILTATAKERNSGVKIFGVELNDDAYKSVTEDPMIDQCMKADFLNDVIISHNSFSFAFVNPPYGTQESKERYELGFLKKMKPYMTKGAVVLYIVSQYVAKEPEFVNEWCSQYDTKFLFRFHDKEYKKYKQVVLFGIKKEDSELDQAEKERLLLILSSAEEIPLLLTNYSGEKIKVQKSSESNMDQFMTRIFHAEEAGKVLVTSPLQRMVEEKIKVPEFLIDNLGRPPIMPSQGHMYLLAVSGAGLGRVGSEKNRDLHLQRGVSKIAKRSEHITDEAGKVKEVEITYPQISYNIIESNGTMRSLQ